MNQVNRKPCQANTFNAICRALKPFGKLDYSEVYFYVERQILQKK